MMKINNKYLIFFHKNHILLLSFLILKFEIKIKMKNIFANEN